MIALNILSLETSAQRCSVALQRGQLDNPKSLSFLQDNESLSHSRSLLPMVEQLLQQAGMSLAELDCIAVSRGPGSFTGLRIGIAVAQGLAFGQQLPVVPVSSLAAVAFSAANSWKNTHPQVNHVLATMDARMGEVYCGWFDIRNEKPVLLGNEAVLNPAAIKPIETTRLNPSEKIGNAAIVGTGLSYREQFPADINPEHYLLDDSVVPDARALVPLASQAYALGQAITAEALTPVYLRNNVTY